MKIGVLALQGAFAEHITMLKKLGIETAEIRLPAQLDDLDGLILPGGESTTMGKLMVDFDLLDPIREFGLGHAIWGTCAGAILLSKDAHREQPLLNLMNITVVRNAFGRQVDSFEAALDVSTLQQAGDTREAELFHALFIRAPIIESLSGSAKALVTLPDGKIVAAQDGHLLATSFHPELTGDTRFHEYFLTLVRK